MKDLMVSKGALSWVLLSNSSRLPTTDLPTLTSTPYPTRRTCHALLEDAWHDRRG